MNSKIITKDGRTYEFPYFQLETMCQSITEAFLQEEPLKTKLEHQKQFYEFKKQYKTFSPYFDFVFLELKATLYNPYLIPESVLRVVQINGVNYYYVDYQGDKKALNSISKNELKNPLFMEGKEKNVIKQKIVNANYENLQECFITENLEMLSLDSMRELHNFWARMWVHELLSTNADVCVSYLKALNEDNDLIYYEQASFLQKYYNWIRFCIITDYNTADYVLTYNSQNCSKLQKEFINDLMERKLVLPNFIIDTNDGKKGLS